MKRQHPARIVESDLAAPATAVPLRATTPRREGANTLVTLALLGLMVLVLVVAAIWIGILCILDAAQGHPLSSWHHLLAWLDSAKGWLIALVISVLLVKWGLPTAWRGFKAWRTLQAEEQRLAAEVKLLELQERDYDLRQAEIEQRDRENERAMQIKMAELAHGYRLRVEELKQIPFTVQGYVNELGQFQMLPAVQVEMERTQTASRAKQIEAPSQPTGAGRAVTIIAPELPERRRFFTEVFASFTPTKQSIFLLDTINGPITGPIDGVTHIAMVGPSGGGKTITTRMLTAQFQYVGAKMYLCSPNFAQLKLNGNYLEDWRPIVQHLAEPPAQTATEIDSLLKRFKALFEKRKAREQETPRRGVDLFLVLGEWPGIVDRCPDAPEIVKLLLREARQYGIHLIFEFQDALVQTLGLSSGARENIRHAYYYGGDQRTAKFALSLPNGAKLDETGLGKQGGVFMRSLVNDAIVSGRVPLFNNAALYMLLGAPPDPVSDDPIEDESQVPETYYHVENGRYVEGSAQVVREEEPGLLGTEQREDVRRHQAERQDLGPVSSETRYNGNLTVIRGSGPSSPEVSETDVSGLPDTQDSSPREAFIAGPNDGLVPEEKHDDLAYFYAKEHDVKKALRAIGVGNHCFKHASYILELRGLKTVRRA